MDTVNIFPIKFNRHPKITGQILRHVAPKRNTFDCTTDHHVKIIGQTDVVKPKHSQSEII